MEQACDTKASELWNMYFKTVNRTQHPQGTIPPPETKRLGYRILSCHNVSNCYMIKKLFANARTYVLSCVVVLTGDGPK